MLTASAHQRPTLFHIRTCGDVTTPPPPESRPLFDVMCVVLQIHAEGGRYIGRALRSNTSLVSLNLRLNRLTDEGGRMLLEGLHDNLTLACLNLR